MNIRICEFDEEYCKFSITCENYACDFHKYYNYIDYGFTKKYFETHMFEVMGSILYE